MTDGGEALDRSSVKAGGVEMTAANEIKIFRAADAKDFYTSELQSWEAGSEIQNSELQRMVEAGAGDGSELRVLVDMPGFSVIQIWFKRDFPLMLHSHDADCLYYILAGSIRLGHEKLGTGDSFLCPRIRAIPIPPARTGWSCWKSARQTIGISKIIPCEKRFMTRP